MGNKPAIKGSIWFMRLTRECLRFPGRLAIAVSAFMVLAGSRLYLTWLVKLWTEGPLISGDRGAMARLIGFGLGATGIMVAAVFASEYMVSDVNQRMLRTLRDRLQDKLLKMGVAEVRRFHRGDLFSRIFNDVGVLSFFVNDVFKRLVGEVTVAVGSIAMMFYLNWRLALATCVIVPAVALVLQQLAGVVRSWATKAQRRLGRLSALFTEQVQGITTIKGFQTEAFEHNRFVKENEAYRRQFMGSEFWAATLMWIIWAVTGLGLFGLVWYGSVQVTGGEITAGALLAFCLYAGQTVEPLRKLSDVYASLQRSYAAAERVFEVIDGEASEPRGTSAYRHAAEGHIEFSHVRFQYRDDEPVLQDVDFSLAAKDITALVASSGGGKSTLAKLLVRFYDPQSGRILMDGIDIKTLKLPELRRQVCVVEQDPFVFSGPLIDNIRYGTWEASRREIESAIQLAGLGELVAALPEGLSAPLGEGGHDLSGGQKQRISLARAIVRNPSVLVLDEATSAIDGETERHIFAQMKDWLAHRTVLVMAHRLSTIARFRRVIVLDGGRVVGDGKVSELAESCEPFRALFSEQLYPLETGQKTG